MKKFLKITILSLGLFFIGNSHVSAEIIKSFDSRITVNTDSTIDVVETIKYDSEGLSKHGIYRDIRPLSSEGKKISIKSISVTDENGMPDQWQRESDNGNVRLKIGDPDTTFEGEKTYVIQYTVDNAIAFLEDKDEIYWNTTGNAWPFTIQDTTAHVVLPKGTSVLQSACYKGSEGSTTSCDVLSNTTQFASQSLLFAGEGMTVAVGFPKGIVVPKQPTFLEKYGSYLFLLLPLIVFILCYRLWKRKGKDPTGKGIIVAQYDVADALTPMEAATIVYEKTRSKDIAAEIIYLATKGYLTIKQLDKKIFGFISTKDYELTLLKDPQEGVIEFDRKILLKIFSDSIPGSKVLLSTLTQNFYREIPSIEKSVRSSMLSKGYYKNLPNRSIDIVKKIFSGFLLPLVFLVIFIFSDIPESIKPWPVIISIVLSLVIFVVFQTLMPAKTEKGVATKDHLLGLKDYLQVAEKDRLNFHNAPEKKPELFETLLPFAMVFGVEKAWAKEFEGLTMTAPSWYQSDSIGTFNSLVLMNSLSDFNSAATASFTSSPQSSGGSGGGGFSGGGGGGGGGGSW